MIRVWVMLLAMLALVVLPMGCGKADPRPKPTPVSGTVLYNGKPLPNARVTFLDAGSSQSPATGTTNSSGQYRLTTYSPNDGAIPGVYTVVFSATEQEERGAKGELLVPDDDPNWVPPKSLIPERYTGPATSGEKREVIAKKSNVFNFELKD